MLLIYPNLIRGGFEYLMNVNTNRTSIAILIPKNPMFNCGDLYIRPACSKENMALLLDL